MFWPGGYICSTCHGAATREVGICPSYDTEGLTPGIRTTDGYLCRECSDPIDLSRALCHFCWGELRGFMTKSCTRCTLISMTAATIRKRIISAGVPNVFARTAALRQLVVEAPAPVIAGMLGFHPVHTAFVTKQARADWSRYAPGDHSRNLDRRRPQP